MLYSFVQSEILGIIHRKKLYDGACLTIYVSRATVNRPAATSLIALTSLLETFTSTSKINAPLIYNAIFEGVEKVKLTDTN